MSTLPRIILAASCVLAGCEKQSPPPTPARTIAAPPPAAGQASLTPATGVVVAPEAGSVSGAPSSSGPEATDAVIIAYNLDLAAWINSHDTIPKDLNELKSLKGMAPLPKPPPGKRIVYVPNHDRPQWSKIRVE